MRISDFASKLRILLFVLTTVVLISAAAYHEGSRSGPVLAAASDLPPGFVPGAKFTMRVASDNSVDGRGVDIEEYEIISVRGTYVQAKPLRSRLWVPNAKVWINLGVVDQFALTPAAGF